MSGILPAALEDDLGRRVLSAQRDWRAAGVAAAVVRDGGLAWTGGAGAARVGADGAPELDPREDVQFRIGSITKTFTAALVMQCRDEGLLELDDRLGRFLPETRHGDLTVRRMLCHLSGLQREPVGEVWERPEGPDREELLAGLEQAEDVLPPGRRWHYSNLAFSLLGEVVSRLRHTTWEQALAQHLLEPLGLLRTTVRRSAPHATGYYSHPYADVLLEEPEFPGNAFAPAAELWSTPADLARWAAFLADPDPAVLAPATLEEMCHPQVMHDLEAWSLGWGLGLMLHRRGDRILVGHDGAMPGFLAGMAVRRSEKVGAVVMVNTSAGADPGGLAIDLALAVVDGDPQRLAPWRPGPEVPAEAAELLGGWWSEGSRFVFAWREGRLEVRRDGAPSSVAPAVLAREGEDVWRSVSGREQGEVLRVVRAADGSVDRLYWATYPFTREPRTFGTGPIPF